MVMRRSHVFDPEHIAVLDAEDRNVWQNPDEILKAVQTQPHFVAADLGCGSGYFTIPLARRVRKVYGIDVQEEMLSFLEDKMKKLKITNVEPLLSKPDEIPLGNESVDLLISVNTLHEFGDKKKIVREMWRVLEKEGRLLIVDFKKEETGFGPPVWIRVSKAEAVKIFESAGFVLSSVRELQFHYLLVFVKE